MTYSQINDLNPIEMLWHNLKQAGKTGKLSDVAELQQFCKDESVKIPPQLEKTHCQLSQKLEWGNHFVTRGHVGLDFFYPFNIKNLPL